MNEESDQQAIEETLGGNPEAYNGLVERYQRRLLGLLWHACGDRELAEDLTQETFARAYRKLNLFGGQSQFYTWLARISLNLLSSNRRRKRLENQFAREGLEIALESAADRAEPVASLVSRETQMSVRAALEQLDEERRIVVLMRDFDGMDYAEIATTLGIPVGTVRSRLHRARMDLRKALQPVAVQLGLDGDQ
jgi:RNA polymerase sigma-70 factor, ECF subfamily